MKNKAFNLNEVLEKRALDSKEVKKLISEKNGQIKKHSLVIG